MRRLLTTIAHFAPLVPYPYQGETVACDLCGGHERVTVCGTDRRLKPLRTVACRSCGLVRTDPMPREDELKEYYARGYRFDYQFAGRRPPRFHRVRARREAAARLASLAPVLWPGARVLDFGSGSGEFLAAAAAAGHRVLGIEPGEDYAAHAREVHGVEVIAAPWREVDLPEGSFDLISANHVLEHLREPVAALRALERLLAPGGVIHVAVPNVFAARGAVFERFHFAHVYNFSPDTLLWAGSAAGLEPDPRIAPEGTTIVFRRRAPGAAAVSWRSDQGPLVAARLGEASALGHILSGRWLTAAARRWRKAVRDSFRRDTAAGV